MLSFYLLLAIFSFWGHAQSMNLNAYYPKLSPAALYIHTSSDFEEDLFPRPPSILANIVFWKRIYGEYSTNQIVFSDYNDLSLIYCVRTVPSTGRARENAIKEYKKQIASALEELQKQDPTRPLSDLAR